MTDILKRYTPYHFEQEIEIDTKTGKERVVGVRTIFHKSFLRNKGRVYNPRSNSYESEVKV